MKPASLSIGEARRLWLKAQRLDRETPFGSGPAAVRAAIEHLGYVQIDTINVIERCHHHILFNRIPAYRRDDLDIAQSVEKTVFEYWTHALSYIPARDIRFFLPAMKAHRVEKNRWFANVSQADLRKAVGRVRREGALTIRDVDEKLIEKDHPWASRKPTKQALQMGFYNGELTISGRTGMVKTYEIMARHFGWERPPRPATERQVNDYVLDRALRAQGIVSLDSICHLDAKRKPAVAEHIARRVKARKLVPIAVQGLEKTRFWAEPSTLEETAELAHMTHVLSPFDPLIIQRKRTAALFQYDHLFEAYVPKAKRKLGYFALPVLVGEHIVAAIDMKADRQAGTLLIQNWTWTEHADRSLHQPEVENALDRFERFQFDRR
ncbi:winged helix-turn-helix domain-containing protein [Pararhizobium haloflavum]|uniref:winged helix-turn-helix domain-containing protein n=1 Tax=Pararhizobium haloflavum TaxID=2037914 RepID=UPI000C193E2A|nr:crosslink repair DNA glycosylase YcaQ family protein [Pararhizobium haloflavum]